MLRDSEEEIDTALSSEEAEEPSLDAIHTTKLLLSEDSGEAAHHASPIEETIEYGPDAQEEKLEADSHLSESEEDAIEWGSLEDTEEEIEDAWDTDGEIESWTDASVESEEVDGPLSDTEEDALEWESSEDSFQEEEDALDTDLEEEFWPDASERE